MSCRGTLLALAILAALAIPVQGGSSATPPDEHLPLIGLEDVERITQEAASPLILINFWATWCGPCLLELPELARLREAYAEDLLSMVGISFDFDPATYQEFLDEHPIPYATYLGDPRLMTDLGIEAIPKTLLLDRNGRVLMDQDGRAEYETLNRAVKQALETLPHEDPVQ